MVGPVHVVVVGLLCVVFAFFLGGGGGQEMVLFGAMVSTFTDICTKCQHLLGNHTCLVQQGLFIGQSVVND